MPEKERRPHSPEVKAKVALEAIIGQSTIKEIAEKWKIHPTQVNQWKKQGLEGLLGAFTKQTTSTKIDLDNAFSEIDSLIGKTEKE